MKKKNLLLLLSLALVSCGQSEVSYDTTKNFKEKIVANNDFEYEANIEESDMNIDGKMDEEKWNDAVLSIQIGGTTEVAATVDIKLYFGEHGITVGYYCHDTMVAASTSYNDSQFVINSDNIEFYIDSNNDKGSICNTDDYAILVNPEEYSLLWAGTGAYWSDWSGVIDYAVTVDGTINNDSDVDGGWGAEIFMPFKTIGGDINSTVGVAFGCRDKTSNLKTSSWCGWTPDPQVIDTYVSINKDGVVKNQAGDCNVASGKFSYNEDTQEYTSESVNSILVAKDLEMRNGTYSAEMYISSLSADNGIIFQVKESETGLFFEDVGSRYYFWCINRDGNGLLGKTNNGKWTTLDNQQASYKLNDWNVLKVVVNNNDIYCFVNGVLLVSYREALYSTIKVGVRAGASGVKYRNIQVSDSVDISETSETVEGYNLAQGSWTVENNTFKPTITGSGALIVDAENTLTNGTLTCKVTPGSAADNGIVFRLDDGGKAKYWESGVSYYFLFINLHGCSFLGRVYNGWQTLGEEYRIDNFDVNKEYTLKVVLNGNNIKCYIDDVLTVDVDDSCCTGNKYGLRAGSSNVVFKDLVKEEDN